MQREYPPQFTYLFVTLMSVAVLSLQATLPFLVKRFGGGYDAVGLLIMWGSFCYVLAGLFLGRLSNRLGPRRVMLGTLAICGLVSVLLTVATSLGQVYVLVTIHFLALCRFWAATEHATTGLHVRLSLVQSTLLFCVAFSVGNCLGVLASGWLQGRTLDKPLLVSAALTLLVMVLVSRMVSPRAGFPHSDAAVVDAFPDEARARLRRLLVGTRPGLVAVYGGYAMVTFFVPRYLWEQDHYSKGLAGSLASAMFVVAAATYLAHLRWPGWQHRLGTVRLAPWATAAGLLVIGATAHPAGVMLGIAIVGVAAATVYAHNLCYSLEEPGKRARNAGIHEAIVGVAYMLPPALSGLAARWTREPRSIFWVGAALAAAIGGAQHLALALHSRWSCAGGRDRPSVPGAISPRRC